MNNYKSWIKPGIGLFVIAAVLIACNWAAFIAWLLPISGKAGVGLAFAALGMAMMEPAKKEVSKVYETKDYDKFHFLMGNRKVDDGHVKEIIESIKLIGNLGIPIIVNEKYEIIDGQHRYYAWFELNLPIKFIIKQGWGIKEAQSMNSTMMNWTDQQFLKSFCDMECEEYIKYKEFKDKFGFGHAVNIVLLTGSENYGVHLTAFKRGTFQVKRIQQASKIAEQVLQFANFYPKDFKNHFWRKRTFVMCFRKFYFTNGYDHDKMLQKMAFQAGKLTPQVDSQSYAELLIDIYNHRTAPNEKLSITKIDKVKFEITSTKSIK